ncbi:hypothetical protein DMH04_00805 [Kibdelosporangium aridum]|uniref:Uncharacterized protein n=1 Tax=Kibdelosporangium aridum TaxID=2030 RepID=A0A428ZU12_KIBAR|nr:hypothetical protein [Kibdelosporangium aridum]RSM91569.1 hypothetical protein DMH04_00805 [Kibdelosporangium aridum]
MKSRRYAPQTDRVSSPVASSGGTGFIAVACGKDRPDMRRELGHDHGPDDRWPRFEGQDDVKVTGC